MCRNGGRPKKIHRLFNHKRRWIIALPDAYQSIAMLLKKKAALYIIVKSLLKKECLLTGASYLRGGTVSMGGNVFSVFCCRCIDRRAQERLTEKGKAWYKKLSIAVATLPEREETKCLQNMC